MTTITNAAALPIVSGPTRLMRDRRRDADALRAFFERARRSQTERRRNRDRRATPRVLVELSCEETADSARYMRLTKDLSTFGLAIEHGATPALQSIISLRLYIPDADPKPLDVLVEVLAGFDEQGGFRGRFFRPPEATVQRIHSFLCAEIERLAENAPAPR